MTYLDYAPWKRERYLYGKDCVPTVKQLQRDGIHSFVISEKRPNLTLDFLASGFHKTSNKTMLVAFNGALSAKTIAKGTSAPFFSGLSLAKTLGLPILCVSDPTMALDRRITMAWYAGNEYIRDLPAEIARVLDVLIAGSGMRAILVGGSAGGYAALNVMHLMQSKQVSLLCWNPQTSISEYQINAVSKYMNVAYGARGTNSQSFKNRASLKKVLAEAYAEVVCDLPSFEIYDVNKKIIYLQNSSDFLHLAPQAGRWLNKIGLTRIAPSCFINQKRSLLFFMGDWGDGHIAPPLAEIVQLIRRLEQQQPLEKIAYEGLDSPALRGARTVFWLAGEMASVDDLEWTMNLVPGSHLSLRVTPKPRIGAIGDFEYAFYLRDGRNTLQRTLYSCDSAARFSLPLEVTASLAIVAFIRDRMGAIKSFSVPVIS